MRDSEVGVMENEVGELLDSTVRVTEPVEPQLRLGDIALINQCPGAAWNPGRIYYIEYQGQRYLRKARRICGDPARSCITRFTIQVMEPRSSFIHPNGIR